MTYADGSERCSSGASFRFTGGTYEIGFPKTCMDGQTNVSYFVEMTYDASPFDPASAPSVDTAPDCGLCAQAAPTTTTTAPGATPTTTPTTTAPGRSDTQTASRSETTDTARSSTQAADLASTGAHTSSQLLAGFALLALGVSLVIGSEYRQPYREHQDILPNQGRIRVASRLALQRYIQGLPPLVEAQAENQPTSGRSRWVL
jgi:hypothetical protein